MFLKKIFKYPVSWNPLTATGKFVKLLKIIQNNLKKGIIAVCISIDVIKDLKLQSALQPICFQESVIHICFLK